MPMNQTSLDTDYDSCLGLPRPAVGAVVRHNNCFLLVRRANAPSKGRWTVPGGRVKPGETLQQAAQREVLEETGVRVRALEPVQVFDLIERKSDGSLGFHYVIVNLMTIYISGDPAPGSDALEAVWAPINHLEDFNLSRATLELFRKFSSPGSDKNKIS